MVREDTFLIEAGGGGGGFFFPKNAVALPFSDPPFPGKGKLVTLPHPYPSVFLPKKVIIDCVVLVKK